MRVLPEEIKEKLSEPIGPVFNNEEKLVSFLKKQKYFVCIGDSVTYTVLKNKLKPFFCVVDYKTRRGPCLEETIDLIKTFGDKIIKIENPPGCISDSLWETIKNVFLDINKNITYRIEVKGEEDLASLPAIFFAPTDVTVIYGLPDRGVLIVKPTNDNKAKVKKVLDVM